MKSSLLGKLFFYKLHGASDQKDQKNEKKDKNTLPVYWIMHHTVHSLKEQLLQ